MQLVTDIFGSNGRSLLKHESHTPLYHQIYTLLKAAILDGTLENGAQVPTELQLASAFDVSRITVKRAMDELANDKLVERRRAKGTHARW